MAAVILDVACGLGYNVLKEKRYVHIFVMAAAFIAAFFFRVNVIYIILAAAFTGICMEFIRRGREKRS